MEKVVSHKIHRIIDIVDLINQYKSNLDTYKLTEATKQSIRIHINNQKKVIQSIRQDIADIVFGNIWEVSYKIHPNSKTLSARLTNLDDEEEVRLFFELFAATEKVYIEILEIKKLQTYISDI